MEAFHLLAAVLKVGWLPPCEMAPASSDAAAAGPTCLQNPPGGAFFSLQLPLVSRAQSAGSGAPKSLSGCGPALAAATLAAVKGPFSKPQRHVEALKLACQALESAAGAKLPAGKGGWQDVKAAAAAVQDSAADNPKLCAALSRLEGLLADAPAQQQQQQQQGGKRGKGGAAAPKGGPAKKKQKS